MVTTAVDGEDGYGKVKKDSFDLVITDIKMPKLGGMALIQKVREEVSTETPIIVITGHATIDIAIESLKHGTEGFVMKPFTPKELIEAVTDALRKSNIAKENIKLKALLPLFEVNKRLLSELNIERLMDTIVREASKYTGAERASLMVMNKEDGSLSLKAYMGVDIDTSETVKIRPGEGIAGMVAENMTPLLLDHRMDLDPALQEMMNKREIRSALCMPIIIKGDLLGVLNLAKVTEVRPFTHSDMEMVSVLCGQAGIAIENARLYEKLESSYIGIIATLASTIEARDPYTAGHAMRMADYCRSITVELGLSDHYVETVYRAALLHDIGKIGIPDHILLKISKLTDEEYLIMKGHPEIGVKILEGIVDFRDVGTIIRHHHEFYNGKGYHVGLSREDIPLGSRILAVADAYEAMTTTMRPYRMPVQPLDAVDELVRMSEIQFDPRVVDAFLAVLAGKGIISSLPARVSPDNAKLE
ncbi:MAG: HD domain-containing protein [Deltaproteobacteria bacterium]|nr:HD domain-containing protein [Deltaproteobacteria bacterium]